MELGQLRVLFTVVITLFISGLLCLPFENSKSASFFILLFSLLLCIVIGTAIGAAIFFKSREEQDDEMD